jgi:hypothetical protein
MVAGSARLIPRLSISHSMLRFSVSCQGHRSQAQSGRTGHIPDTPPHGAGLLSAEHGVKFENRQPWRERVMRQPT